MKQLDHIPVMEIVFFRCLVSAAICFLGIARVRVDWKGNNNGLLIARGTFGTVALFLTNKTRAADGLFGFVGFAFGMLYAAFYLVIGHFWGAAVIVVCSAGFGAVAWVMRSTRRLDIDPCPAVAHALNSTFRRL